MPIPPAIEDIRSKLSANDASTIIFKLSTELELLLGNTTNLSGSIMDLLHKSKILYDNQVFRVSDSIIVKLTNEDDGRNEYLSLKYLHEQLPRFPVPQQRGLIQFGSLFLLFTAFIPGVDLEEAWPRLDDAHKRNISSQLDTIFLELRSLPFPEHSPLGGVGGNGCKDVRRGI